MITRALFLRAIRQPTRTRTILRSLPPSQKTTSHHQICHASHIPLQSVRPLSSYNSDNLSAKTPADAKIEEITELYATAQDEFEIAMEETEKVSVYAEDDRKAAREELTRVQEAFKAVVEGEDRELAEEVRRRIGQRIRELEQGVTAMEELALSQD